MSQIKKDHLWELIHTISPTEKAYFKKQSNIHSSNGEFVYLKLFDDLNSILKFDLRKIELVYESYHQASRLKNYLYELILSALEGYASNNNKVIQSKRNLVYAKILFEKGLLYKAKKNIEKCLEQSIDNYDYYTQLEAIAFRKKIYTVELNVEEVKKSINKEEEIFATINEINKYELVMSSISSFSFSKGNILSNVEKKRLLVLEKNKFFKDAEKCKSILAKSLHYRILSLIGTMTDDMNKSLKYAILRFKALEHSKYKDVDQQNYINTLNNLIYSYIETKHYKEAALTIDVFTSIKPQTAIIAARIIARKTANELRLILTSGQPFNYKYCNTIAMDCANFQNNLIRLDEKIETVFFMITLCFNNMLHKEVKNWFSIYYLIPKSEVRIDIQCYLFLLHLYIQYSKKDLIFVNYLLKNEQTLLLEKKQLNEQETRIFDFIQNQISSKAVPSSFDLKNIKTTLKLLIQNNSNISIARFIIFPD